MKVSKTVCILLVFMLFCCCLSACDAQSQDLLHTRYVPPHQTDNKTEAKKGYRIAFSNSYIGNAFRTQTISAFEDYAEHLKDQGLVSEYYISSSGVVPQDQIAEIEKILSQGYDAIVLNAASPTALAPILEEAVEKGTVVVAFDNAVDSSKVYNIGVNNYQYGYIQAEWLRTKIEGKGNIIIVRGMIGTSVSTERGRGYNDILKKYPKIAVVDEMWSGWDHATVSLLIGNFLDAHKYDNIVGVLDEAGGEAAIIEAMVDRGMDVKKLFITGGIDNGFLRTAKKYNMDFMGVGYPPYMSARALELAVKLLQGEKVDYDGFIEIPNDIVTPANVDKYSLEDEPDEAFADIIDTRSYHY